MNPDQYTIAEHTLDVGHGHMLYIQDWGYKKAKKPIIFLHGGPGSGCKDKYRLPFDPTAQRVIFFDQRGCGKSTPLGHWHHNNTQELAADITRIADFLKINTFVLTGGSWGSTLALYYAITQPSRVHTLVIHGVFTSSQAEIDWIDNGLFKTHFPDIWERYVGTVPKSRQADPSAYHYERVLGGDPAAATASALAYSTLEGSAVSLDDNHVPINPADFDPTQAILEMRYLAKRCFLPEKFILKNAHKLKMPVHIVQGRYDFVCPPATAYQISKSAPKATLTWTISGHRGEHETLTALRLLLRQSTTG